MAALAVVEFRVDTAEIEGKLKLLDGRGSEEEYEAVKSLAQLGHAFPDLLLRKYRGSKKWGERASCVYHSIKYALNHQSSFLLGLEATKDRSKHVRYRACMLLAVAQRADAIPYLEELLSDPDSSKDAAAALDAIENMNRHYFVDREHSGNITLRV